MNFPLSCWLLKPATFFVVGTPVGCDVRRLILAADPWNPPPEPAIARERLPGEASAHVVEERRPLFGDLHLHTSLSMDGNSTGTRTLPDDADAYATGTPIALNCGASGPSQKPFKLIDLWISPQ